MIRIFRKIVNENSSRARFLTVFGVSALICIPEGILCGWLYNYYGNPIYFVLAILSAIEFFFCASYFGTICVRALQDWQSR